MKKEDTSVLLEIFCSTAEKQAFAFGAECTREELPEPAAGEALMLSSITFKGPYCGIIMLAYSESLAKAVTSNTLGTDDESEITFEQESDAMAELLNVICGQFLTAVEGEIPVFDLTVPHCRRIEKNEWESFRESPDFLCVNVDESPALVSMKLIDCDDIQS